MKVSNSCISAKDVAYICVHEVYLPAIAGHVPPGMVRALSAFLDFCYLVRRSVLNEETLNAIDMAVERFHQERAVFITTGVRVHLSLPRQHAMVHYRELIELFGAPNGLCSSITESKHIRAVKEPWCRSNKFNALGQMLVTNQRLDKLAAARRWFTERGMLDGPLLPVGLEAMRVDIENEEGGAVDDDPATYTVELASRPGASVISIDTLLYQHIVCAVYGVSGAVADVADRLGLQGLQEAIRHFLYDQLYPDAEIPGDRTDLCVCPLFQGKVRVFHSATATFCAPSDQSGVGGMRREIIHATPSWQGGPPHYDCVYVAKGGVETEGFRSLLVGRVCLFFSCVHAGHRYSCALLDWFIPIADEPNELTGMWIVVLEVDNNGRRVQSVVALDSVVQGAHLIGVYGREFIPVDLHFSESLDAFKAYYVNKYIDHQANMLVF